jgi:hypothetical protein
MQTGNKAGILSIGIMIGLIGGLLLSAGLDYMGWNINPIRQITELPIFSGKHQEHLLMNPVHKNNTGEQNRMKAGNESNTLENKANEGYSTDIEVQNVDSSTTSGNHSGDQMKVSTDQLILSKQIKVLGFADRSDAHLDSLLIDDKYSRSDKSVITLEIWQSPINYKGYKWGNNKLLVFGLYNTELIKVKFYQGNYYLNYGTKYYFLETSTAFRNLSPVSDSELIKSLNSL